MKIEKKIEKWCKDARFVGFANQRMNFELTQRMENNSLDPFFEELDEAFEYDDRYIMPLVEYLTCRLHTAKLRKDIQRQEEGIWQVWFHIAMEGYYVQTFHKEFAPLLSELRTSLMPMLHKEYLRNKPAQNE